MRRVGLRERKELKGGVIPRQDIRGFRGQTREQRLEGREDRERDRGQGGGSHRWQTRVRAETERWARVRDNRWTKTRRKAQTEDRQTKRK